MTKKYFAECCDIDAVKAEWRRLCRIYHPDLPTGDLEEMKQINIQYEIALRRKFAPGHTQAETDDFIADNLEIMEKVQQIVHLEGIIIEIVGSWVWVTGLTYAVKEGLKAAGFTWCGKKRAWSWHDREKEGKRRHSQLTLSEIKDKYGSSVVPGRKIGALG